HGELSFRGDRKQAILDATVREVVSELHEVESLAHQRTLHLAVLVSFRCRDPDVANETCGLALLERLDVRFPIHEVVDVHEIEARDIPELQRLIELPPADL